MSRHTFILPVLIVLLTAGDVYAQEPAPADSSGTILIINACDPNGFHARKKKESLLVELADSLRGYLSEKLQIRYGFTARTINMPLPDDGNRGPVIDSLLNTFQAGYVVLFDSLDVFFQQTHVDVSGTKGNKERIAFYDICADIHYCLYTQGKLLKTDMNKTREFFTSRNVISGLLATGPDIVSKKKYAVEMLGKNAHSFLWGIETYLPPGH